MSKQSIATGRAPAAIGPYSQAIEAGGFVFISGQIPLVPGSGELEAGGFSDQVRRVISNFGGILEAAGLSWSDVVKTTVFLTDMGNFKEFNGIYAELFSEDPPARAVVEVSKLPREVLIEMEGVAVRP